MPNILINPNSGILEFNTGTTGSSSLDASLSGAVRLIFSNSGTLGIQSYSTGVVDKFFVEGINGRLFEVDDLMTGSLMSVNDIAGLPILEVFSDDRVVMGQYASNTLYVSGDWAAVKALPISGISLNVSGVSRFNTTGLVISGDSISTSGKLSVSSSTTGRATFNIPHGIAPTSPVDGDIWTSTVGLFARISGSTVGPYSTGGGGSSASSYFIVSGFTGTALTLALGHAGDYIRTTAATAVTITVPPTSSVNWVTDTEIMLEQAGAGQVTFATGTGVVINTSETLKTQKQYSVVALKNVSGDVWTLFGERELL